MNWSAALRLGRVSNLPTVWTNVLAGAVLSGSPITPFPLAFLLLALSLFYIAGMYLNDAFDRDFDAATYPQRPIPSGAVTVTTVFIVGFLGLATGELFIIVLGYEEGGRGWPPVVAGLCLAATIVYYNLHHKNNPLGPLFMGLCRAQVYLTTALAIAPTLSVDIRYGAGLLTAYVIGLSAVARQETPAAPALRLWPLVFLAAPFVYGATEALRGFVPAMVYAGFAAWVLYAVRRLTGNTQADIRAGVSMLIAGISWLDALLMALAGETWLAAAAIGGALLTRLAQRIVPGT